jgi:hypothetical protein
VSWWDIALFFGIWIVAGGLLGFAMGKFFKSR